MVSSELESDRSEQEIFLFPASFAQRRLWLVEQLTIGASLYNVPLVFRLKGALNIKVLAESFNEIVRRHEVLRTAFDMPDGQITQVIASHLAISLPLIDLQSAGAIASDQDHGITGEEQAFKLVQQEIQQPFNLKQAPLLRLQLLRLDEAEHILLMVFHHIIFDEWSSGVLIRELGAIYTALIDDQPSPLPDLPIQYADFACWQREWLQGSVLDKQLKYWQQQLHGLSLLNLPSDRPRPIAQSYQGAIHFLELSQGLLDKLEALSQQAAATLFMTLLTAFQALLSRYTGQSDIAVGSPIANRHHSELEGLIGFFVNSLVLRSDVSGNPTFRELLQRVKETTLEAYAHQDLPFETLVEALQPQRDLSRNPLFQVVFALQNAPMENLELPGLTLNALKFETRTTRFDLELYLWKCADNFRSLWGNSWTQSDGLRGVLVYNTDLFDQATIARLSQHFHCLLEAAVTDPDTPIANLPILSSIERQQLEEWSSSQINSLPDQSIHHLFEQQVERTPDAIAVQFANQQFTYRELNNGSNQLARYLKNLGVCVGTLVGICMERTPETIAAMLAILKAEAVYVPLDVTYPAERLRFMVADARISVILTQHQWSNLFDSSQTTVVCLDHEWSAIAQESEDNPIHQSASEDLAYVIYTSGSTGTPKGVAVPHRAVIRLVYNPNYVTFTPSDRIAQVANIAFDAATFEIWGALLNGAQLIGIEREISLSPVDFATQLKQQQITILFLTTALLNQIAREVPNAFQSLRYLLFGGEAVNPKWVCQVLQQGAPQHLLHVYGPTENTTFSSWYEVRQLHETATTIPIGRAIANTEIYLLDSQLNPVPIGVTGEIYLGGEGLAQGYLYRPELTAERFIPHPFIESKTEELSLTEPFEEEVIPPAVHTPTYLYKTGDLARYRADGNLEFLGRTDDQIKLRGFRVELAEIEATLSQHPQVQAAVVRLCEVEAEQQLVAYLVPIPSAELDHRELWSFLQIKLPQYMLPASFVILDRLPLTANGKVDRQQLPPLNAGIKLKSGAIAAVPQTSLEATLAQLWAKLLGQDQIGVEDNFFELGGHSLLATQLVSRIRDTLQIELPLRRVFETPTIAALAQFIENQASGTQTQEHPCREEVEL